VLCCCCMGLAYMQFALCHQSRFSPPPTHSGGGGGGMGGVVSPPHPTQPKCLAGVVVKSTTTTTLWWLGGVGGGSMWQLSVGDDAAAAWAMHICSSPCVINQGMWQLSVVDDAAAAAGWQPAVAWDGCSRGWSCRRWRRVASWGCSCSVQAASSTCCVRLFAVVSNHRLHCVARVHRTVWVSCK